MRQPHVMLTLRDIHAHIGGELTGKADIPIKGVNSLEVAESGELTFAESTKHVTQVRASRASAVIVPRAFPAIKDRALIRVDNPRLAFLGAVYLFQPKSYLSRGVHRKAVVAPDVKLGQNVTICECAVIRSHACIGRNSVIESGVHIGEDVVLGDECFIGPNVVIMHGNQIGNRVIIHSGTVIGADGFGYVLKDDRHLKIPQLGNVIIEDDVELGANVCVDRATFGSTIIKRGTKIDNLVQIAHNDSIGEDVIMSGQVGLAGSTQVGNRVLMGGQAGVVDHVSIGDDVRIGAATVVTRSIPAKQTVWGYPSRPIEKVKKELAALGLLPKILKDIAMLKRSSKKSTARRSSARRVKHGGRRAVKR